MNNSPAEIRAFPTMRQLLYAINSEGWVYSRLLASSRSEGVAFPVLEFDKIGEGGNFNAPLTYHLEKAEGADASQILVTEWDSLVWTKKIPVAVKNIHRRFWGLSPLKEDGKPLSLPRGVKGIAAENWEVKVES